MPEVEKGDREPEPGQCGDRYVPEEYREVAGWSLQSHDYIMERVSSFWGGHRDVKGFVPWEAERYGHPIEGVALVAVERHGDVVWKLQREHFLGDSYDVNNHPRDRHSDRRESDFEGALEMAREWLEHNPAATANSLFLPTDPMTNDPTERFPVFVTGATEETNYGLVNTENTIGLVTDSGADLPSGEVLNDFETPEEVKIGDRYVTATVDGTRESYAFVNFSPYGFVTGEGEDAPIAERLRVSPASGNAAVGIPDTDSAYLVAPLDEAVDD